ncbi:diguanylate cyclase response regulator [Psychromonas sp. psych-6C06]|uniref:GGDEF domain-containing protein n=1 Tax=Psychromonas sp. psych-6C06 TaxID=2058089 RepID=UPI000C328E20|nr:diguanylate cyclase [Psychromonas sp. psych-6C06]PKF63376.1 diguanylate cyclase response regulator [Psychromonas sp. psych-6C06]
MIAIHDELADILIIDDDPSVIITLNKVLNKIGRIRFAADAKQAFAMISGRHPDLILLDVELPDMRGLEVCTLLKSNAEMQNIPVLFITSNIEVGFEEKVFDVGGADYITKPLNPRVVAARVNTHLNYQRAIGLLENLAHKDSLTGLDNRRSFDEQLAIEFKRSRRENTPLTIVMIDIDQFKKYNDHFGHVEGDMCLKNIASILMQTARRPTDFVARYGGEEFAFIFPDTDQQGAQVLLSQLLKNIENVGIVHSPEAQYGHVTISIGYSTYLPDQAKKKNSVDWKVVNVADQALYQSKQNGRNQMSYESSY